MRAFLTFMAACAISAGAAVAQTSVTGQPAAGGSSAGSGGQPAVTRPNTDSMQPGNGAPAGAAQTQNVRLEPGANSFTEGQVMSRLQQAGFQNITELKKDEQGIWRGKAMQNGRQVSVGFDFKGNVAAQ